MGTRRVFVTVATGLTALVFAGAALTAEAAPDPSGTGTRTVLGLTEALPQLHVGDSVFWTGGQVETGRVRDAALCGIAGECFEWPLAIAASGSRLRVAIDTPSREDTFELALLDSAGVQVAAVQNSNMFNAELFVDAPAAGFYTVRVRPVEATRAHFRLRAKLESAPPVATERRALLPNLRVVPPTELGFVAPLTPNGPYPPDQANPPASVMGQALMSCTPDESAPAELGGAGAVDCLRLTSGPMNVGEGPFDMRFTFLDDVTDGTADPATTRGPIQQAIHHSDGSIEMRDAGHYIFHTTHAHFHDENILTYQLFRVTDPARGTLEPAGSGTKSGFCPADQLFANWHAFSQNPRGYFGEGDNPTGNCFSPTDGLLGLTPGWGDVYRWQRPGQYVEFSGNTDGLYVLRATVDIEDHILESNEADNASYALVQVIGRSLDVVERGTGTSPWDPTRVVYRGSGPARSS